MANYNSDLVGFSSPPKVNGTVYVDFTGTAEVPKDATTPLGAGWTSLGFVSEDGITEPQLYEEGDKQYADGKVVVATTEGEQNTTFEFSLLQYSDEDVNRVVYGEGAVIITADGYAVIPNALKEAKAFVIERLISSGSVVRFYIPKGEVTLTDSITHSGEELASYPIGLTALADNTGNPYYKYVKVVGKTSTIKITGKAGDNGSISPEGVQEVNKGDSVLFSATPSAGYKVANWLIDGIYTNFKNDEYELTNVTTPRVVTVLFEAV